MARRDIVQRAARIRRLLGLKVPIDVDAACTAEGMVVQRWPLGPRVREMVFEDEIAISTRVSDPRWQRYLTAHALGHFELHAGSMEFWRDGPCGELIVSSHENQANIFARALLIPGETWEDAARFRPDWEIARIYQVPVEAVRQYRRDLAAGNYDPRDFCS